MRDMNYEKAWNDLKDFLNKYMTDVRKLRVDNYGDTSVDGLIMFFKMGLSEAVTQGVLDAMEGFENAEEPEDTEDA